MRSIETEAKTVEEAITIACEKLNTKKDTIFGLKNSAGRYMMKKANSFTLRDISII